MLAIYCERLFPDFYCRDMTGIQIEQSLFAAFVKVRLRIALIIHNMYSMATPYPSPSMAQTQRRIIPRDDAVSNRTIAVRGFCQGAPYNYESHYY